jgi:hypothetical protein
MLVVLPERPIGKQKRDTCSFLRDLMPNFLRKVQYRPNWDPEGEFSKYLSPGEAPADALKDLQTSNNRLSVWQIDDQETNLERVLAAIVSPADHIQKFDYLIVESKHIQNLGFSIEKTTGQTHDSHANNNWHFDLTRLSATNLSNLANCLLKNGATKRKYDRDLIPMLKKSIASGYVEQTKLNPKLLERLSK